MKTVEVPLANRDAIGLQYYVGYGVVKEEVGQCLDIQEIPAGKVVIRKSGAGCNRAQLEAIKCLRRNPLYKICAPLNQALHLNIILRIAQLWNGHFRERAQCQQWRNTSTYGLFG